MKAVEVNATSRKGRGASTKKGMKGGKGGGGHKMIANMTKIMAAVVASADPTVLGWTREYTYCCKGGLTKCCAYYGDKIVASMSHNDGASAANVSAAAAQAIETQQDMALQHAMVGVLEKPRQSRQHQYKSRQHKSRQHKKSWKPQHKKGRKTFRGRKSGIDSKGRLSTHPPTPAATAVPSSDGGTTGTGIGASMRASDTNTNTNTFAGSITTSTASSKSTNGPLRMDVRLQLPSWVSALLVVPSTVHQ
jgi:hypothetical protein